MANMCSNQLEFHCKEIPSWFYPDLEATHGISYPGESRFLFLYNTFEDIMENPGLHWIDPDGSHHFYFGFETKWVPPASLYEAMIEDDNIIWFRAEFAEAGCGVLGFCSKEEGFVDEDYPNRAYSDVFDMDILEEEPPETYVSMEGDNYLLLNEYISKMKEQMMQAKDEDAYNSLRSEYEEVLDMFDMNPDDIDDDESHAIP